MSPKPEHDATTRAQILQTAADLFGGTESPAAQFTLGELGERLALHHTAIYHYFENKDHILQELTSAACERRSLNLERGKEMGGTTLDQLLQFIRLELSEPPTNLLVRPTLLLKDPYRSQATASFRATTRIIEKHLEAGIADGSIRECTPRIIANLLTRLLNRYANRHDPLMVEAGLGNQEIIDQFVRLVRDGVAENPEDLDHLTDIQPIEFPILSREPSKLNDIQTALTDAFNSLGYDGTSIPKVADSIGVSKTSFYKYGASKGDLLYLCARHSLDLMAQIRLISKVIARSPLQALLYNIYYSRQLQGTSPGPFLQPAHFHFLSELQQRIVWENFNRLRDTLRDVIESGMQMGEIRKVEPSALQPALIVCSQTKMDNASKSFTDEIALFFLKGISARQ